MAMKENSLKVLEYVKAHQSENITAADIAEGTGLEVRSVNGIVTSAFQRHTTVVDGEKVPQPLMERVPAEVELPDGTHKAVKFIKLTADGEAFDPSAEAAE